MFTTMNFSAAAVLLPEIGTPTQKIEIIYSVLQEYVLQLLLWDMKSLASANITTYSNYTIGVPLRFINTEPLHLEFA